MFDDPALPHPMNLCRVCGKYMKVGVAVTMYADGRCSHEECHRGLTGDIPGDMLPIANGPADVVVQDSYGGVTLTITAEEIGDYLGDELERMRGAATPHVERLVELAIARIKQLERKH